MECPSTPATNVLIEDDTIPLDQSIEVLSSLDRYFSDITCWVPWNRLEEG